MSWLRNEKGIHCRRMIVLGTIIFGISSWIQNVQSNNIQQCNQLTGQFAQLLDSNTATTCSNATFYLTAANTDIVVGIVLTLSGVLLRKTETAKMEQYDIPSTQPCKGCEESIKPLLESRLLLEAMISGTQGVIGKRSSHDGVTGN